MQLCVIFLELAPKYLLTIFKLYVVLCKDFKHVGKKVDGKVVWDEKQKEWLVGRMKRNANYTNMKVEASPVAEWDVSALCTAVKVVSEREDIEEKVQKVINSRNSTCHGKGASHDDLETSVDALKSLILSVQTLYPDHPWDDYLEELRSAADSELHSCNGMICRPLHEALALYVVRV